MFGSKVPRILSLPGGSPAKFVIKYSTNYHTFRKLLKFSLYLYPEFIKFDHLNLL